MADDPIDRIFRKVSKNVPEEKEERVARTHKLKEPNYTVFQRYVRSRGMFVQDVLDEMIGAFLQKALDEGELTTEHDPTLIAGTRRRGKQ